MNESKSAKGVREMARLLAACCAGQASWTSAGELTLMVMVRKSWQADQTRDHLSLNQAYELAKPNIHLLSNLPE